MIWDFTKQIVDFFIRRFYHIVELENTRIVLRILFMCLKNDALDWHNDLSIKVRFEMNSNLTIWKDELFREFRLNRFEFMKKTKKMTFRFDDKNLTLSQYLTRKINLLHDAKIIDENIIVRYLWEDLESQLILVISMRKNDNIIENFDRRVRNNERVARKVYELIKKINVSINRDLQSQNRSTSQNYNVSRQTSFVSFVARIERLVNNYQKTINQTTMSTIATILRSNQSQSKKSLDDLDNSKLSFRMKRSCRHCEDVHWDNECLTVIKKIMIVDAKMKKKSNDDQFETLKLNEKNMKTLETFQAYNIDDDQGKAHLNR